MNPVITNVELQNVQDIVSAGYRARIIAEQLGFDKDDQTRISTAVSEIARNALQYAGEGEIEFFIDTGREPRVFGITFRNHGKGIARLEVPEGGIASETGMGKGIIDAKRLMDHFHIDTHPTGCTVFLGKNVPPTSPQVTPALLTRIADMLVKTAVQNPFEEIRVQNQNLIRMLEELDLKHVELFNINAELDNTNRGVVALYAQLDDQALSLKAFSEGLEKHIEERTSELQTANTDLKNAKEELRKQFDELAERDKLLGESEERLGLALSASQMGTWDLNLRNKKTWRSLRHDQIFGYASLLPEWTYGMLLDHVVTEDRPEVDRGFNDAISQHHDWEFECRILRANGEVRWIWARGRIIYGPDKEPIRMLGLIQDITDRKLAEEAKIASEIRYRRLFETAQDGILILDAETGQIVDANPFLIDLLGFSREQFLGKKIWEIGLFKDIVANKDNFEELQRKEYIRYEDMPLETADGRYIAVEFVSNVYVVNNKKVIQCNIRDITDRKKLAKIIEASLADKETLLKEIHHRVKNNLQIISSLLNLQIRKTDDPKIIEILKDSQARVLSMALVHEHLYESKDFSRIDLKKYIRTLGTNLFQLYGTPNTRVLFDLNVPEIKVGINTAIPLGLIINELITNSLKYAFKGRKDGKLTITATEDLQALTLIVADNGVGMSEGITLENPTSLGLRLVNTLTGQLHGTVVFGCTGGTKYVFTIPAPAEQHTKD
ncbi:MAG: histidine kinase dimerization/phosphoacceptor domain -containing protein [Methanoregula sp.]|jgi:PAS domain S-box-containing protein